MKSFKILALILTGACLTMPACAVTLTKRDAAEIGGQLAKSSLDLAAREFAGEKIDYKAELSLIGFQAASNAIDKVTYNLAVPVSSTPKTVVNAAAAVAQERISQAAVPDPQIQARAVEFADQAAGIAQTRLQDSAPNAPPGAVAGK